MCFIGKTRNYQENQEELIDSQRTVFIRSHCKPTEPTTSGDLPASIKVQSVKQVEAKTETYRLSEGQEIIQGSAWTSTFQARSGEEIPRNCVRVDRGVRNKIMEVIFKALLEAGDVVTKTTEEGRTWNAGGSIALPEAAAMIDAHLLQQLKCECGGLQTLLKNSKHIFKSKCFNLYV